MGIGLNLTMNLVQMHGGMIEAHSAGPSQGSQFTVRLPVATANAPLKACHRATRCGAGARTFQLPRAGRRRQRRRARHAREHAFAGGPPSRSRRRRPEAIEVARRFLPNLILLDIGLPGLSGIEVAKRLRAEPELQKAMLIALTGYGSDEDMRRSLQAGHRSPSDEAGGSVEASRTDLDEPREPRALSGAALLRQRFNATPRYGCHAPSG